MKKFMELLECDFRSGENKYCLLKSPEGFTSFQDTRGLRKNLLDQR